MLIAVVPALAGCLNLGPFGQQCEFAGDFCHWDGDAWIVEGVTVVGNAKLYVTGGDRVIFRDVHVEDARSVEFQIRCACVIEGENFTIEGASRGVQVSINGGRDGHARNVTVAGISITNGGGVYFDNIDGGTTLSDMQLACVAGSPAVQWYGGPDARQFTMQRVVTSGCADVVIGSRSGNHPLEFSLMNSTLAGTGLFDGSNDGLRPTSETHIELRILDSRIQDTRYALNARVGTSVEIRNSTLAYNHDAIDLSGAASLTMSDSILEGNGYGISARGASVEITRTKFLDNGPHPNGDCGGAIVGDLTGTIHDSVFEGNSVALSSSDPVDARNNYWGSATGPVPGVMCLAAAPAVQSVGGVNVQFIPFLTAPPDWVES